MLCTVCHCLPVPRGENCFLRLAGECSVAALPRTKNEMHLRAGRFARWVRVRGCVCAEAVPASKKCFFSASALFGGTQSKTGIARLARSNSAGKIARRKECVVSAMARANCGRKLRIAAQESDACGTRFWTWTDISVLRIANAVGTVKAAIACMPAVAASRQHSFTRVPSGSAGAECDPHPRLRFVSHFLIRGGIQVKEDDFRGGFAQLRACVCDGGRSSDSSSRTTLLSR